MFNEEQKIEFIRKYTTNEQIAKTCEYLFKDLQPFEEEEGMDICAMSVDVLQPAIEAVIGLRIRSRWRRMAILRAYVDWCIEHNIPGACDAIGNVKISGTEAMRTRMVPNPIGLQRYLDDICDPESYDTNDNVTRVIFWLLYGGAEADELPLVRASDVDFVSMTVHINSERGSRDIPIYREGVLAFYNCVHFDQFARFRSEDRTLRSYRNRSAGDILIRGTRGLPSLQTIRVNIIKRRVNDSSVYKDLKLSPERVRLSGLFYRISEEERNGVEPDFNKIAQEYMDQREYNTDDAKSLRDMKNKLSKAYREDYECWKLAFSI